jgi:hypothetical protein
VDVAIDEEVTFEIKLAILKNGTPFNVLVTIEADRTFFSCPRWRNLAA